MTRRDFLKQCAALAVALAVEVLALPRELAPPSWYVEPRLWAYTLQLVAGAEVGQATLRRGDVTLLRVAVGRHGFGAWVAPRDGAILWSPDLRLVVSDGVVAAVPFQDRVLFASDTEQRWLSTRAPA